jgi:DNA-binding IclR family transcriptional regulator
MIAMQKVIEILELFLNSESELSLSEMSISTGLNKSTVNRIASFLVSQGYLNQKEKRGKYSLGMKFLDFSSAIKEKIKIRDIALQNLAELKNKVEESCGLVIWDGKEATLIDIIHNNSVLRVSPDVVTKLPLHPTACGKIFLSNMPSEKLEEYLRRPNLNKYTSSTVVDPKKLRKEILGVMRNGVAFDIEEHMVGISSVGSQIKDYQGNVVAAVVVVGPTARLTRKKLMDISPMVKECAMDISRGLGWQGE